MAFLQTVRECSILLPVFDEPVRNFEKIEKRVKSFGDVSKMIDFIGRAPNGDPRYSYGEIYPFQHDTTIKQIRVFVGLILQPEMDPPKIIPDPR